LIVGLYEDGTPGELFITMAKEGSTIGGLMDSLGTAISLALQYGVPVESIVNKFAHQRFEPMGMTTNSDIPFAKSLVDYIFRWLGMQFIEGYRDQNAPRRTKPAEISGGGMNAHGNAGSAPISNADAKEAAWQSRSGITTHDGSTSGSSTQGSASHSVQAKADAQEILSRRSISVVVAESIVDGSDGVDPQSRTSVVKETVTVGETRVNGSVLDQSNAHLMGDAPACDGCGSITVRNGTCYRCLNCGSSMGCS
jgi:ribonucleoside-diphosphate reductase alpha chain